MEEKKTITKMDQTQLNSEKEFNQSNTDVDWIKIYHEWNPATKEIELLVILDQGNTVWTHKGIKGFVPNAF